MQITTTEFETCYPVSSFIDYLHLSNINQTVDIIQYHTDQLLMTSLIDATSWFDLFFLKYLWQQLGTQ